MVREPAAATTPPQDGIGDDSSEMIQQLGGEDIFFFEVQTNANHNRSAHADAMSEADGKAAGKIKQE